MAPPPAPRYYVGDAAARFLRQQILQATRAIAAEADPLRRRHLARCRADFGYQLVAAETRGIRYRLEVTVELADCTCGRPVWAVVDDEAICQSCHDARLQPIGPANLARFSQN